MNKYNIIIFIFYFALIFVGTEKLSAQNKFKAAAVFGINSAQLGGDSISGYDKLGFSFGGKLGYQLSGNMELNFELLYSQRGSRETLGFSSDGQNTTALNYLEIPIYLTLNDWKIEKEDYYKVGIFGGFTYGYLISADSTNPILSGRESEFKQNDISLRAGVYYSFTKRLTFRTYYTDSLISLVEGDLFNTNGLDSFFWTFRLDYNL